MSDRIPGGFVEDEPIKLATPCPECGKVGVEALHWQATDGSEAATFLECRHCLAIWWDDDDRVPEGTS